MTYFAANLRHSIEKAKRRLTDEKAVCNPGSMDPEWLRLNKSTSHARSASFSADSSSASTAVWTKL
jgi:hypothetical protein